MSLSSAVILHRDAIKAIIAKNHGLIPRETLEVCRYQDSANTQINFLIWPSPSMSLIDQAGMEIELTELLGVPVAVFSMRVERISQEVIAAACPL